ncbi:unnamed protein product [Darwinula stevensoni]|uniref:Uncharacterized protein n=1 Tax=Darwinula stevensoni TaxID=69355 RepID=A0A7R9A9Y0_9CRUS|nr:unnamed protein product [Darwinula stevensoni]CAG0897861.1 unnamed protein product [Darwinula stevensoni]
MESAITTVVILALALVLAVESRPQAAGSKKANFKEHPCYGTLETKTQEDFQELLKNEAQVESYKLCVLKKAECQDCIGYEMRRLMPGMMNSHVCSRDPTGTIYPFCPSSSVQTKGKQFMAELRNRHYFLYEEIACLYRFGGNPQVCGKNGGGGGRQ